MDRIADIENLVNFTCATGKNRSSDLGKVAKAIHKAARNPYHLSKTVNDYVNQA